MASPGPWDFLLFKIFIVFSITMVSKMSQTLHHNIFSTEWLGLPLLSPSVLKVSPPVPIWTCPHLGLLYRCHPRDFCLSLFFWVRVANLWMATWLTSFFCWSNFPQKRAWKIEFSKSSQFWGFFFLSSHLITGLDIKLWPIVKLWELPRVQMRRLLFIWDILAFP